MDRRYQVFVSSTYHDLKSERQKIMMALMKMNCIPAGMEHFPASDEEQFNFIKKIIDDSDYYLLIIGGRYGSVAEDGISYTEKEFDYAVSKKIRVVAIIHDNPSKLSVENSESSQELKEKLENFKEKVKQKRLVEFWNEPSELSGKVALSIIHAMTIYPAIGWMRADKIANEESLNELIKAKNEVESLRKEINELKHNSELSYSGDIADFDSAFVINYIVGNSNDYYGDETKCAFSITWSKLYHFLSPYVYKNLTTRDLFEKLTQKIHKENDVPGDCYTVIDESDLMTIELQFTALGLIDTKSPRWELTPRGVEKMLEVRIVK